MSTVSDHPLVRLETAVLIAIGGFAGSNLRYFVELIAGPHGLLATLVVNVVGSFALGFVLFEAQFSGLLADRTRLIAATGFLSSFTTYSTFAVQTARLTDPLGLFATILSNYGLALGGVLLGRSLARRIDGADR